MDKITSGKILVGSTGKMLNKARLTGDICMENLFLLNILNNLINDCKLHPSHDIMVCLEEKARTLQNLDKDICNYRQRHSNYTNIGIKKPNNYNSLVQQNNNIVSTDNFSTITDNEILIFDVSQFTDDVDLNSGLTYGLKITSLPSIGLLVVNNNPVIIGQVIPFSVIENNIFKYIPNDININYQINFNFQIIII